MPALDAILAQMGAVPQGATPKNINLSLGQTEPSHQDTSTLGLFMQQMQADEKKRQDEMKRKSDLYNTLRNAGYSSEDAMKTIESGKFIGPTGESLEDQERKTRIKYWNEKTNTTSPTTGIKVIGNSLVDSTGKVLYRAPSKKVIVKTQLGGAFEYDPDTGEMTELIDEMGNIVSKEELPPGITEKDIAHTLKLHPEYTRETLLKKLRGQ